MTSEQPTLPHEILKAIADVVTPTADREALHPVDMFGEVAEIVRNVDLMDEYADAIEQRIWSMLAEVVADQVQFSIEADEGMGTQYEARSLADLTDEIRRTVVADGEGASVYVDDALRECKVLDNGDAWATALRNQITKRVDRWLGRRHDARWMSDADAADVLAEYQRIVIGNDALQAVKDDDLGEVHFEIVETAEDMGFELTEEDADALADLVDAWRATIGNDPCRCSECADIHADFIGNFGRWPDQTHAEGQALKARRIACEASWTRATR